MNNLQKMQLAANEVVAGLAEPDKRLPRVELWDRVLDCNAIGSEYCFCVNEDADVRAMAYMDGDKVVTIGETS